MKRMIVFSTAFVIACFILAHIDRKSGAESMSAGYDTSILKTLDCLDCEVYYDPYFEDYKILDIESLTAPPFTRYHHSKLGRIHFQILAKI